MKIVVAILIILVPLVRALGQNREDLPLHIALEKAVDDLRKQQVDTIYTYYRYCSGCDSGRDEKPECEGFLEARVVWQSKGKALYQTVDCNGRISLAKPVESKALAYFIANRQVITQRKSLPKDQFYPALAAHFEAEEFTLIVKDKAFQTTLTEEQREDKLWDRFSWIKPTRQLAKLNQKEKE